MKKLITKIASVAGFLFFCFQMQKAGCLVNSEDNKRIEFSKKLSDKELKIVHDFIKKAIIEKGCSKEQASLFLVNQLRAEKKSPELDWKKVTLYIAYMAAALGFVAVTAWAFNLCQDAHYDLPDMPARRYRFNLRDYSQLMGTGFNISDFMRPAFGSDSDDDFSCMNFL